jgi:hypothetical protein
VYGDLRKAKGVWSIGPEYSNFVECAGWDDCNLDAQGCWFEASSAFWEQIERKTGEIETGLQGSGATILIEVVGRRARSPGPFGHLAEYPCQIRAEELISAERLGLNSRDLDSSAPKG